MNLHELAEERSLAYHRAVADRLREAPELVDRARSRVDAWIAEGGRSRHHAARWRELLDLPVDELVSFMVDAGEEARELRQSTPFAGFIDARERWRIWREVRARMLASA